MADKGVNCPLIYHVINTNSPFGESYSYNLQFSFRFKRTIGS
jgi:hypothetical protein